MLHEMAVSVLERPVYGMWQVDNLLGLRSGTARRWIDGYERRGQHYAPVIRPRTTGVEIVTWGEFVEARLLANYRDAGVPLVRLRPIVERLRADLGTPYPLATARWLFVDGRELVQRVQDEINLEPGLRLVEVVRTGQYAVTPEGDQVEETTIELAAPVSEFLDHVGFDDDDTYAARIFPLGRTRAVTLDPVRAFGAPAVRTIRTDVLAEEYRAGDSVASIARSYDLKPAEVDDAIEFERRLVAA